MPIKLITGLPGAGKTLRAVYLARQAIKQGRPVFVYNINGLQPFGWHPLEDLNEWEKLPDGSLVIADEVQDVWKQRGFGDPIPPVQALSKHRHRGFDFVLLTQNPTFMDTYVRKLVNGHEHLIR